MSSYHCEYIKITNHEHDLKYEKPACYIFSELKTLIHEIISIIFLSSIHQKWQWVPHNKKKVWHKQNPQLNQLKKVQYRGI